MTLPLTAMLELRALAAHTGAAIRRTDPLNARIGRFRAAHPGLLTITYGGEYVTYALTREGDAARDLVGEDGLGERGA